MTYQFARQAALQLQYNRWSDTAGFLDEATNSSFNELVRQKETVERWRLTDEHLSLSIGILPDEINNRWFSARAGPSSQWVEYHRFATRSRSGPSVVGNARSE
jgi:hypothetical protein